MTYVQVQHVWPCQVQKDAANDVANFQNAEAFSGLLSWYLLPCKRSPLVLFLFWIRGTDERAQGFWTVCQEDGRQTIASSNRRGKWFSPLLIRRVGPCSSWDVWVPPSMSQQAATLKKADQKLPFFTYRTSWSCKILFRLQNPEMAIDIYLIFQIRLLQFFFVDLSQDSFRKPQRPEHHRRELSTHYTNCICSSPTPTKVLYWFWTF